MLVCTPCAHGSLSNPSVEAQDSGDIRGLQSEVVKLLDKCTVAKKTSYLVKWKGNFDDTWDVEPRANITVDLIQEYEAEHGKNSVPDTPFHFTADPLKAAPVVISTAQVVDEGRQGHHPSGLVAPCIAKQSEPSIQIIFRVFQLLMKTRLFTI